MEHCDSSCIMVLLFHLWDFLDTHWRNSVGWCLFGHTVLVGHKRLASYSVQKLKVCSWGICHWKSVCFGQGLKVAPWCPPSIHWRHCTTRCPSSRWTSSSPRCVRTEARHNSRGSNVSEWILWCSWLSWNLFYMRMLITLALKLIIYTELTPYTNV